MDGTFRDAYLVERGGKVVGAVRRDGVVWRVYVLGRGPEAQPTEAFASRAEAGERLLALVDG